MLFLGCISTCAICKDPPSLSSSYDSMLSSQSGDGNESDTGISINSLDVNYSSKALKNSRSSSTDSEACSSESDLDSVPIETRVNKKVFSKERNKVFSLMIKRKKEIDNRIQEIDRQLKTKYGNNLESEKNSIRTDILRDILKESNLFNNVDRYLSTYVDYDFHAKTPNQVAYEAIYNSFKNHIDQVLIAYSNELTDVKYNKITNNGDDLAILKTRTRERVEGVVNMYKPIVNMLFPGNDLYD